MYASDPVSTIKGIGPKIETLLNKWGIHCVEDLLYFFPYRYEDETRLFSLSQGSQEEKRTFRVKIIEKGPIQRNRRGLYIQRFRVADDSSFADMVLFNQTYLDRSLNMGDEIQVFGKVDFFGGKINLKSTKIEKVSGPFKSKINAIYSSTSQLSSKNFEAFIKRALEEVELPDPIPPYLKRRYGLMDRLKAIKSLHSPQTSEDILEAKNTLIFEEFFIFQLSLLSIKSKNHSKGIEMKRDTLASEIEAGLPFELTTGQKKCLGEIKKDMCSGKMMQRLVQGDVGSGKTIIALLAISKAVENGYQAMLMAPTEILASQHMKTAIDILEPRGIKVELLTGSTSAKRRREILENVELGLCDLLIGTHALIGDKVIMPNLGLTITDEQHRFGVEQRETLQNKVKNSHKLIMTATPIPRSLGLVLYGDMDISTIDTLPSSRKPVKTIVIGEEGVDKAFDFMKSKLEEGVQAYVVCPLIEENDKLELDSVTKVYETLKNEIFSSYKVELLHGKMAKEEKEMIMNRFSSGQSHILVSTTVIEVGVNVPNANLLFIYNAERFGLATLHQLRGRIGRGNQEAFCILYSGSDNGKVWERLKIIESSTDGFYIAEKDMELRGTGQAFGTMQSGMEEFRIGNPIVNIDIMKYAQLEAKSIVEGGHLNNREEPELNKLVEDYIKKLTL